MKADLTVGNEEKMKGGLRAQLQKIIEDQKGLTLVQGRSDSELQCNELRIAMEGIRPTMSGYDQALKFFMSEAPCEPKRKWYFKRELEGVGDSMVHFARLIYCPENEAPISVRFYNSSENAELGNNCSLYSQL